MEDPDSPGGLVTDGPSQPRITNRAQGGARSDKTRFIRPVERQRMRPWLIGHLDENDIPGLVWQERRDKIFRISWKHAANQCFNMQKDTNLFERWAIHTGRHQDSDHKRWKANFRCALNSLPDVAELKEQGVKKGNNAFKVYRFLNEKEVKRGKETRQRKKRESMEFEDEEDNVVIKGEIEDSYFTDEPGTSTEVDLGTSGSSIPDLTKLVSSGSALDFNIESKEGLKQITGNMDSLQEILAAATASLAAGSDALALEKISIEQLSHLGEASKVKLDIRQSDRKRRKKEVTGILYVFLCHWCEKVFPSRVDLYQHFLIVHQDKLLSGEEYKMKRETLQQEIEDLEKKVLGFTQDTRQGQDSGEVIEDGQVVDLSSNNSMTSQEVYIEDQALDLSIAGAMAKHSATQPDVALDLSINNSSKQKAPAQKNVPAKGVIKRRRSSAMDVDYTVKFGNYGLAGAPRTKRQLSLLLKKKEEEEEKQRKHAEAQHSMEDIAHAEILISLKSAASEENESESIELDDKAVKEAVNEQACDVNMQEDNDAEKDHGKDTGEPEVEQVKDTGETNPEVVLGSITLEKLGEETVDSSVQELDKVDGKGDKADNAETPEKENMELENFEQVIIFNEQVSSSGDQGAAKLISLGDDSVKLDTVQLQSADELNEHSKTQSDDNECHTCEKAFHSVNELLSHLMDHTQANTQAGNGVHGIPTDTVEIESALDTVVTVEYGGDTGDASSTSSVSKKNEITDLKKMTGQKNLQGESVVSPAAGSKTMTGGAMNECSSTDTEVNRINNKGDAARSNVADEIPVSHDVNMEQGDSGTKMNVDNVDTKVVGKPNRNDVVDGEHLLEADTDMELEGHTRSKIADTKVPKISNVLSLKGKMGSIPVEGKLLKSDIIRKDMVLCGLCNLRLDFKDVKSHLESHKFAQDRDNMKVKEDCPCMICDEMIPIKTFYSHLRSHSVYDLSVALSTQMSAEKQSVKKGKHACNLCYSTFITQADLMSHVKSHLGPRNATTASEPKTNTTSTPQKRKLPASEKKGKKLKTSSPSRKSVKKKQAKGSSTSTALSKALENNWINDDESLDLFQKTATVALTDVAKSELSPALTAALKRKPTSIMDLYTAQTKGATIKNENKTGDEDDSKVTVNDSTEDHIDRMSSEGADADVSYNEIDTKSETGEEKTEEDQNFLAASRRLQEFVTLKQSEGDDTHTSEPLTPIKTEQLTPTVTLQSLDTGSSSTTKSKKGLQQKILLVRHGDVKVATPFFSPVSSVAVETSQPSVLSSHKPVTAQTKRISNVPVLSTAQVTYIQGKTKKLARITPEVTTGSSTVSTSSIITPTAIPVSLVRNLFNLPIGKNASLSTVTLKKKPASGTQKDVPLTVSDVGKETTSVSGSSVQKMTSSPKVVHTLPKTGAMNVNINKAKSQPSANKSVVQPGTTTPSGVKSPVFQFVSMGLNSVRHNIAKPLTSIVGQQRILACNNCRQPLSSIEQMSSHVCATGTACTSTASKQLVSVTMKASAAHSAVPSDLKTSSVMSVTTANPHTKILSSVLTAPISPLKLPSVWTAPSTVGGIPACAVQSSQVGKDKAKFVLSRSAILTKSLPVPLNSITTSQTGSVISSLALPSTESSIISSNVVKLSTGSPAGMKEGNHAVEFYPCSLCRQIYVNQDSFIKHMQEHVSTMLDNSSSDTKSIKTISKVLKLEHAANHKLNKYRGTRISVPGAIVKRTDELHIESLFTSDVGTSMDTSEGDITSQTTEMAAKSSEVSDIQGQSIELAAKSLESSDSLGQSTEHAADKSGESTEVQSIHTASDSGQQVANDPGGEQHATNEPGCNLETSAAKKRTSKTTMLFHSSPAKKFKGYSVANTDSYMKELAMSCDTCNVCFSSSFQLKAHRAIWHRSNKKGPYASPSRNLHLTGRWEKLIVCELCGKRFFSLTTLQKHRDNHVLNTTESKGKDVGSMKIVNSRADIKSRVKSKLEGSSIMGPGPRGKWIMFTSHELEQYITKHEVISSQFLLEKATVMIERLQNDFQCMFCEKFFASSDFLKQHLIKNHCKKLFQCVDCEQYFHPNISLMIHRKDCAVRAFSDQDFHTKKKYLGCNVCYRSFIQLVSLACYIAGMKTNKPNEIVFKPDLKSAIDHIKTENEKKSKDSLVSKMSGKFVCIECRNEYCDAADLYTCMRNRIDHKLKKVLRNEECGTFSDTVPVFSNDTMFYCNKCETIVCCKPGDICLASLQHPCVHSETLI